MATLVGATLIATSAFAQTVLDVTETTVIDLRRANIETLPYLSFTSNLTWSGLKTYCEATGDFFNLSNANRIITINASNVESFEVRVSNSNAGRAYNVQVDNQSMVECAHTGSPNCQLSNRFETNAAGQVAIKISGGGASVYPVEIILHPAGGVVEESDVATLSALTVDGATVADFKADTYSYDVVVPFAYATLPVVAATTTNNKATAAIEQAVAIPGSAAVEVTAEKGNKLSYTVNFTRATASELCAITAFTVAEQKGATVINEEEGTIELSMLAGTNVSALTPMVRLSANATVDLEGAQDFTSPVTYTVTAEDGVTAKTYTVTVNFVVQSYLENLPYSTDIPAEFEIPAWMEGSLGGLTFNGSYTGSDAAALGSGNTVLRVGQNERMELFLSGCGTATVTMSATGGRTYKMYVNGVEVASTGAVVKDTKATLTYDVNSNEPVVVAVENVGTGGATIGSIELTAPVGTSIGGAKTNSVVYANGVVLNPDAIALQLYTINGVRVAASNSDIELRNLPAGIYIVRGEGVAMKIMR